MVNYSSAAMDFAELNHVSMVKETSSLGDHPLLCTPGNHRHDKLTPPHRETTVVPKSPGTSDPLVCPPLVSPGTVGTAPVHGPMVCSHDKKMGPSMGSTPSMIAEHPHPLKVTTIDTMSPAPHLVRSTVPHTVHSEGKLCRHHSVHPPVGSVASIKGFTGSP